MIATDLGPHNHHPGKRPTPPLPRQEAVMGKAVPSQHPAVVLRSHFRHLRALLAVAMIAVVGLTAAVVILATDDDQLSISASSAPSVSAPGPDGIRYDGGPEEGTTGIVAPGVAAGIRYDGGPEEGTSGALSSGTPSNTVPGIRYDGGPEEGSSGAGH
jgi:hypothetical protein